MESYLYQTWSRATQKKMLSINGWSLVVEGYVNKSANSGKSVQTTFLREWRNSVHI